MSSKKYNKQQKLAIAISAITGAIIFGFLMMLIDGGFSYSVLLLTLVFALFMGFIFPFILKKLTPALEQKIGFPDLHKDETITFEGKANLFRNRWIADGGKLFLTNQRLIFKAHKLNLQKGETSINLQKITDLKARKTLRLVDNGLRVEMTGNAKVDFVVEHRSAWIDELEKNKFN